MIHDLILLAAAAALVLAMLLSRKRRNEAGRQRAVPVVLAPEIQDASEALRQLTAEAERTLRVLKAARPPEMRVQLQALPVKTPKQIDRQQPAKKTGSKRSR